MWKTNSVSALLERHRLAARFTIAGQEFLTTARSALAELKFGARRAVQAGRGPSRRLRIEIFASIASGLPRDAIASFRARHVSVESKIFEGETAEHFLRIRERRLEVASCSCAATFARAGDRDHQLAPTPGRALHRKTGGNRTVRSAENRPPAPPTSPI